MAGDHRMAARERIYSVMANLTLFGRRIVSRHHNDLLLFDADSKDVLSYHIVGVLWIDVLHVAERSGIMEGQDAATSHPVLLVIRLAPRFEIMGRLELAPTPTWDGATESWRALPAAYATNVNGRDKTVFLLGKDVKATRRIRLPLNPGEAEAEGVPFAVQLPDAESIVVCTGGGRYVTRISATTGEVQQVLETPGSLLSRPGPIVTNDTLWVAAWDAVLRIDLESGDIQRLPVDRLREDQVIDFALDPSQRRGAMALASSGAIVLFDVDAMEILRVAETAESLQRVWIVDDWRYVAQVWGEPRFVTGSFGDA
jgi:hypothetical protein